MYLIDTDILSAARRPDRAPHLRAWFAGKAEADLHLSAITIGEIERGIRRQDRRDPDFATDLRGWLDRTLQVFADRILPFGSEEARLWGRLSAEIGHTGADLMIAATALSHGAVVVTGNARHFSATGVDVETPA